MKKFIAILAIALTMMSMSVTADAARRFGGGSSFGRQAPSLFKSTPAPKPAMAAPKAQSQAAQKQSVNQQANASKPAAAKPASPMRGMLMGLAAALGISALAHALGFGEAFTQFLMIALCAMAAFFVIRLLMGMFMGRKLAAQAPAQASQTYHQAQQAPRQDNSVFEQSTIKEGSAQAPMAGSFLDEFSKKSNGQAHAVQLPADFNEQEFLKVAEANFVKMQKAWDTGNVTALSDFTSDEIFTAVTHQLRERGAQDYQTEIVTLKSQFQGMIQDGDDYLVGVYFEGTLNVSGESEQVRETWILTKPVSGKGGWILSGIHQENE